LSFFWVIRPFNELQGFPQPIIDIEMADQALHADPRHSTLADTCSASAL
jgi:hypothetical protein